MKMKLLNVRRWASSLQRMVRRLVGCFDDWRLRRMPVRVILVEKPLLVRVYLMGDEGETWLAQIDWEVTAKEWPALNHVKTIMLGVDIWEGEGIVKTSVAHLLPDTRRSPLPYSHAHLAVAETSQTGSCVSQPHSKSESPPDRRGRIQMFFRGVCSCCGVKPPNDPSSATRPTKAFDCNRDAMAGFAAAHG